MIKCKKCNHPIQYSGNFWFHKKFSFKTGLFYFIKHAVQWSKECWKCDCEKAIPYTKDKIKNTIITREIFTNLQELEDIFKLIKNHSNYKNWIKNSKSMNKRFFDINLKIKEQPNFTPCCEVINNETIYKYYKFLSGDKK